MTHSCRFCSIISASAIPAAELDRRLKSMSCTISWQIKASNAWVDGAGKSKAASRPTTDGWTDERPSIPPDNRTRTVWKNLEKALRVLTNALWSPPLLTSPLPIDDDCWPLEEEGEEGEMKPAAALEIWASQAWRTEA